MFNLFKCRRKNLKTINRTGFDYKIRNFIASGITENKRDVKIIVSLTSFPERMEDIQYTLYSLLNQEFKPDELILWLSQEEFPNKEKDLPQVVLKFRENGLQIKWCENLYSYKKLIPTLKEYKNCNCIIVTADDDIYYEKNWLLNLYKSHMKEPNCIICHRAHKIKFENENIAPYKKWRKKIRGGSKLYKNFFTGAGGVLYPPNSLYKDIDNVELFTRLAPKADDIWFWAMAVLNETPICIAENRVRELTYVNPDRERGLTNQLTLFASNKKGGNDIQLSNIINHYPQILDILKEEKKLSVIVCNFLRR